MGSFTIVDSEKVSASDVGNKCACEILELATIASNIYSQLSYSFFLPGSTVGQVSVDDDDEEEEEEEEGGSACQRNEK